MPYRTEIFGVRQHSVSNSVRGALQGCQGHRRRCPSVGYIYWLHTIMLIETEPSIGHKSPSTMPAPSTTAHPAAILQQRLLLLNHANKCCANPGETCSISRHCRKMRKLWPHLLKCSNQNCRVPHCLSSRYVLTHYAQCTNTCCSICPRVRDSAKREVDSPLESTTSPAKKQRTSDRYFWWSSDLVVQPKKIVISVGKPPLATSSNKPPSWAPFLDKLNLHFGDLSVNRNEISGSAPSIAELKCASRDSVGSLSIASGTDYSSFHSSRSSPFAHLSVSTTSAGSQERCDHTPADAGADRDISIFHNSSVNSSGFDTSNCSYQSSAATSSTSRSRTLAGECEPAPGTGRSSQCPAASADDSDAVTEE